MIIESSLLALFVAALPSSSGARASLLDPQAPPRCDHGCSVVVIEGVAVIDVIGGEAGAIDWQLQPVSGPAELRFRLKTSVSGDDGEYVVYWLGLGEERWTKFRRVPIHADGHWHDYCLPLADHGSVVALRFSFGQQSHRVELADVRVAAAETTLPAELAAARQALPVSVEAADDSLRCQFSCQTNVFVIDDDATGRTWTSEPTSGWLTLCGADRLSATSFRLQWFDLHTQRVVTANVEVRKEREIRFTYDTADPQSAITAAAQFPPRFSTSMDHGRLVFCDRSCGVLLAQDDPAYADWPLRVYGNTHCLDMPWIGVFDKELGDGAMLLVETPTDAEVALVADSQGRHWPEVRWLASMDSFGGQRAATLQFTAKGGYVSLAKAYRERLKKCGRLKTLREKTLAKPHVERLRGAPFLWGGDKPGAFLEQMQALGITRGVINGCTDAPTIAWLNEQGYLTGRYDSYTDILPGKVGFQRDDVVAAAIRSRPGGPPKLGWQLENGKQMYWRSSAKWLDAENAYVTAELKKLPYTARFIDVAAAAELFEDHHPQRLMTRGEDLANRRAMFQRMNDRRLVLGTEHGNGWAADQVDYFEGAMSGPFWWSSWPAGHLKRPTREQLSPNYLKFGIGYAHRVPIWELVYHDCAVSTWYWGDTAGMLYQAAPELADRKDLLNILYGTPPLIWMDGRDYSYPADLQRMLQTFHDTCPLHEVVAMEELINHEFLSDDLAVQRTRFGDGTVVAVNFADEPRPYANGEDQVMLAPRGYFVSGPGFRQSLLWIDDAPHTIIAKEGYLTVASSGERPVAGVRSAGRTTLFRMHDDRWNVIVEPNLDIEVNVRDVTGWYDPTPVTAYAIAADGTLCSPIEAADEAGIVHLRSSPESWQFALVRGMEQQPQP